MESTKRSMRLLAARADAGGSDPRKRMRAACLAEGGRMAIGNNAAEGKPKEQGKKSRGQANTC